MFYIQKGLHHKVERKKKSNKVQSVIPQYCTFSTATSGAR